MVTYGANLLLMAFVTLNTANRFPRRHSRSPNNSKNPAIPMKGFSTNLGHLPLRRPNGPRNATPLPITLSSMYFMIFIVSSGRLAVTKAARGFAGRNGKSSPLSDRLLVRLAFFRLILTAHGADESLLQAPSPTSAPSSANSDRVEVSLSVQTVTVRGTRS